eukprot:scaffold22688_cov172-Cylindrotheca_fusiformis.AAC.3
MKWNQLMKDSAWVVEDLLTKEECEYLLQRAVDDGIESKIAAGDIRHRNSTTVAFENADMSDVVFERIKRHIPQEVVVDDDCENLGLLSSKAQLYGRWKPFALNTRWRVACYPGEGHFGPHRDGARVVDEHHRSLITINGFLTDRANGFGGATRFIRDDIDLKLDQNGIFTSDESDVLHRVEAEKAGTASVFFHDLMHDGEPLKEGSPPKWIFRTEVMYERDPLSAPKLSARQEQARKLLSEAEETESRGDVYKAISLYNQAYRLDPDLERV